VTGKYFVDSKEAKADPRVLDEAFAERLWTESERLIATVRG
jgi:hypothetical protein